MPWGALALILVGGASVPANAACPAAPSATQVIIYQDPDGTGNCAVLGVGDYATTPFGSGVNSVSNDLISSIRVGSAVSADLFQHGNFGGWLYHYENGPFLFNLGGYSNDDVSSIKVKSRTFQIMPADTRQVFNYSVVGTDSASNSQAVLYDLGTMKAGTTVRFGTCSAGGDLPTAAASGDTYLRVLFEGVEKSFDDDGCGTSLASYMSYTVPYTGNVTIKAGCYSANACSGTLEVAYNHPDSNGSISNVAGSFNVITGDAPRRNKLNFGQTNLVTGAYQYHVAHKPHFQGIQRVPRALTSTSDAAPRFLLSGSDNADIYTVTFSAPNAGSTGLVGPLPDTPVAASRVTSVESNGYYYDSDKQQHLGGMQTSGRWLAGGIEKGGGPGPSMLRFWDLARLPNPRLVKELNNTGGSAGAIAIIKLPGKNQGFLMFVSGQTPTTAQVWVMTGAYGYADLLTGSWVNVGTVTLPDGGESGFQSINFVSQDDGGLYLVATVGYNTTDPNEGADTAVLMTVTGNQFAGYAVHEVARRVFICQFDSNRQCAFNASGSIFVDADLNVLRLYATKPYRPDDGNAPMTFVEYY